MPAAEGAIEDPVGDEELLVFVGATVARPLGDAVPDVAAVGDVVLVTFMVGDDVS